MPHKFTYYPEQHLLNETFYENVTIDELRGMQAELLDIAGKSDTSYDILIDVRLVEKFPTALGQIKEVMNSTSDPNIRWIIMIASPSPVVKFILTTITQMLVKNARYRMFESYEEAVAFLEQLDPAISLTEILPELVNQT